MKFKLESSYSMDITPGMKKTAVFSVCRTYRYTLHRVWDAEKPLAMFIGLNPSTADETHDDPTVRRCINYAKSWGYGGMIMTNIFAFRATKPAAMKKHTAPVGPQNDHHLQQTSMGPRVGLIVACWGNHGLHLARGDQVMKLLPAGRVMCLGTNANGSPKHPLYVHRDAELVAYSPKVVTP